MIAFLSTLSLRRATKICKYVARRNVISIHALLAESDIYCHLSGASYSISIHALLAESDGPWSTLPIGMANFYPRSPCGERLVVDGHRVHITRFLSTLSLRRATLRPTHGEAGNVYFYPRSPCGERPPCQSPSLRGVHISIHALLAESDVWPVKTCIMSKPFLSTLSLRRATSASRSHNGPQANFYPRSPCGERRAVPTFIGQRLNFYPRSPCGERQK